MGGGAKKDVRFVGGTVGEIGVMEVDGSTKKNRRMRTGGMVVGDGDANGVVVGRRPVFERGEGEVKRTRGD